VTAEAYARMLKALLPPSKVWALIDSLLSAIFLACADELVRVGDRVLDLLEESDPRTTLELLPDFERVLGLVAEGSLDERRARVVAQLLRRQRARPADFQQVLAPLFGQATEDVAVIERDRAFALLVGDDREIYRFFIYRDPSEGAIDDPEPSWWGGAYDLDGAQALVDDMAHSHTQGHVIESVNMLCDDLFSLCDRDMLGADYTAEPAWDPDPLHPWT
jgi:hypothetical protein